MYLATLKLQSNLHYYLLWFWSSSFLYVSACSMQQVSLALLIQVLIALVILSIRLHWLSRRYHPQGRHISYICLLCLSFVQ